MGPPSTAEHLQDKPTSTIRLRSTLYTSFSLPRQKEVMYTTFIQKAEIEKASWRLAFHKAGTLHHLTVITRRFVY